MERVIREKPLLTLIVPAYNEENNLSDFYSETSKCTADMAVEVEYLFINDGSEDRTVEVLKELCREDSRVRYLSFSRNFGKEAAIYAGLQHAHGDYAAIMDADLQDPPELLPRMYDYVTKEGYDCAAARRVTRAGEGKVRSFCADMFYKAMTKLSGMKMMEGSRDFQLMNRKMINAVLSMKEKNRFSKGIFEWVGFQKKWVEYENVERSSGSSKWSLWKLFRYALDGITSFSSIPLMVAFVLGCCCCFCAGILIFIEIIGFHVFPSAMSGWTGFLCLLLFLFGIQFLCMGILGKYLEKTYDEVKNRPLYLLDDSSLCEEMSGNEGEE